MHTFNLTNIIPAWLNRFNEINTKLQTIVSSLRVNLLEAEFVISEDTILIDPLAGHSRTTGMQADYLGGTYHDLSEKVYRLEISNFGILDLNLHHLKVYFNGYFLDPSSYNIVQQVGSIFVYIKESVVAVDDVILVTIDRIHNAANGYQIFDTSDVYFDVDTGTFFLDKSELGSIYKNYNDFIFFKLNEQNVSYHTAVNDTLESFIGEYIFDDIDDDSYTVSFPWLDKDSIKETQSYLAINRNYFVSHKMTLEAPKKVIDLFYIDRATQRFIPIVSSFKGDIDIYINGVHQTEEIDYTIKRKVYGKNFLGWQAVFQNQIPSSSEIHIFRTCLPNFNTYHAKSKTTFKTSLQHTELNLRNSKFFSTHYRLGNWVLKDLDIPISSKDVKCYSLGQRIANTNLTVEDFYPYNIIKYNHTNATLPVKDINLDLKIFYSFPTLENLYNRNIMYPIFSVSDNKKIEFIGDLIQERKKLIDRMESLKLPKHTLEFLENNSLPLAHYGQKTTSDTDNTILKNLTLFPKDPIEPTGISYGIGEHYNFSTNSELVMGDGYDTTGDLYKVYESTSFKMEYLELKDLVISKRNATANSVTFESEDLEFIKSLYRMQEIFFRDYVSGEIYKETFTIDTSEDNSLLNLPGIYAVDSKYKITLLIDKSSPECKFTINTNNFFRGFPTTGVDGTKYFINLPNDLTYKFKPGEQLLVKGTSNSFLISVIDHDIQNKILNVYCNTLSEANLIDNYKSSTTFTMYRSFKPWFPKLGYPSQYVPNPFYKKPLSPESQISLNYLISFKDSKYKYPDIQTPSDDVTWVTNDAIISRNFDIETFRIEKDLYMLGRDSEEYQRMLSTNFLNFSKEWKDFINNSQIWKDYLSKYNVKKFFQSPAYSRYLALSQLTAANTDKNTPLYKNWQAYIEYLQSSTYSQWLDITNSNFFKSSALYQSWLLKLKAAKTAASTLITPSENLRTSLNELIAFLKIAEVNNEAYNPYYPSAAGSINILSSVITIQDNGFRSFILNSLRNLNFQVSTDIVEIPDALMNVFISNLEITPSKPYIYLNGLEIKELTDLPKLNLNLLPENTNFKLDLSNNLISTIPMEYLPNINSSFTVVDGSLQYNRSSSSINLMGNQLDEYTQIMLQKSYIEKGKSVLFDNTVELFKEEALHVSANMGSLGSKDLIFQKTHKFFKPSVFNNHQYNGKTNDDSVFSITKILASNLKIIDPTGIELCENLEILDLSNNLLFEIPQACNWKSLNKLRYLNLNNNLRLSNSNFFSSCSTIEELYLSKTKISTISFLNTFTKIKALDLSFCPLDDLDDLDFGNLPRLEVISLANTNITDIGNLLSVVGLRSLNLNYNPNIQNFSNKVIKIGGNLENLELAGMGITNSFPILTKLENFQNLSTLNVADNELTSFTIYSAKLTSINLHNNNLTSLLYAIPGKNINENELTDLDLSENMLTSIPNFLENFPNLLNVNLSNNSITTLTQEDILARFHPGQNINLRGNVFSDTIQALLKKLNKERGYHIQYDGTKLYNVTENYPIQK